MVPCGRGKIVSVGQAANSRRESPAFPESDTAPVSPNCPVGTLETFCWYSRSLVDTIAHLKWERCDSPSLRLLLSRFNRDLNMLGDLSVDYEKAAMPLYPVTGLEIDGHIETCCAGMIYKIGHSLHWDILQETSPERHLLLIRAVGSLETFIPIDCDAAAKNWGAVRPSMDDLSEGTLKRISIAMLAEHIAIVKAIQQRVAESDACSGGPSESRSSPEVAGGDANVLWHGRGEEPPAEYVHNGPLRGRKKDLARWITEKSYARDLDSWLAEGTIWGRENDRYNCSVWFKNAKTYAVANQRMKAEKR